ncbi:hypothetical protein [Sulfobacillus thermosulfidooxidans]|uniref:hypothetical protein n=1 Tax=Sulfobacillus thermosulfidooxidans TaxID=28034 RepID=UPI0006B50C2B|nr:hypothetical protein [Sulfobacillus thermosulfidooxidans]
MSMTLPEHAAWRKGAYIETPDVHATLLHPSADGYHGLVTLAQRIHGQWHETILKPLDLPWALREIAGTPDAYLTQNRFKGARRIAHLWQLGALWTDLDYHKMSQWQGKSPEEIWELAKDVLEEIHLPRPTLVIATGRGLALVWIHTPIPRPALPRWNACQRQIYAGFKTLGADRAALDAARVLRLIGTENAKNGQLVRALTPTGDVWNFEALADVILPLHRGELSDLRVQRALRHAERPRKDDNWASQRFSIASLWEARLSDLQTLLEQRWWGVLPPGQRDLWLFLAVNAMSWLTPPEVLMREAWALAKQVGGWDEREAAARLQAIFKRSRMAAQGQALEWNGKAVDPRYAFKTQTILEWLKITPEEQRHMRVLIGPEEKRRRHREAESQRKRQSGEVKQTRADYEAQARARRVQATQLRNAGKSYRAIAAALGCSVGEAYRLLNG